MVSSPLPVRSLSPSRASDFTTCPLLFRFRSIDKLPEAPSKEQVRGTLVHLVLERLFSLPADSRTEQAARTLVPGAWEDLQGKDSSLAELFDPGDDAGVSAWLASVGDQLQGYFSLEDPRQLEPAERESFVRVTLPTGLELRGIIDRLDRAVDGRLRVVDYKTGRSPSPQFESKALFQLKFYALVLFKSRGVIPTELRLMYLGDRQVLSYAPDEADLAATERMVTAIWGAINDSVARREFKPTRSRLCGWCAHQALCPEFGGTPPPFPA